MRALCYLISAVICSVAAKSLQQGRIIGGQEATRGQFPYQAAIFSGESRFCMGVLISDTDVLTAAHCVSGNSRFEVHLGAHILFSTTEPGHVIVNATEVSIHEMYQHQVNFDYDLAVVHLPQPVMSGEYIAPVRLPARSQQNEQYVNDTAFISGWGNTDDLSPWLSEELMYAEVRLTSEVECVSFYGDTVITERQICASTNEGTVGMCSGDTGGPLTVTEADGQFTLVGIANFGSAYGCEKDEPNVYARMTTFLDWIETNAPGVTIRP